MMEKGEGRGKREVLFVDLNEDWMDDSYADTAPKKTASYVFLKTCISYIG